MRWMVLVAFMGCRSEVATDDSGERTEIGDVDTMAAAWCAVLECREGFEEELGSVAECTDFYSSY